MLGVWLTMSSMLPDPMRGGDSGRGQQEVKRMPGPRPERRVATA